MSLPAYHTIRTDSKHPDFIGLVARLDSELAVIDGDEHAFYHQFNGIENLDHVMLLYVDDVPVACGAMKSLDPESMEIKRMYTDTSMRKRGLASVVLSALEEWARELGFRRCVLETGKRMPGAVALYKNKNYTSIPNYGPYIGIDNSVCFEKPLANLP